MLTLKISECISEILLPSHRLLISLFLHISSQNYSILNNLFLEVKIFSLTEMLLFKIFRLISESCLEFYPGSLMF